MFFYWKLDGGVRGKRVSVVVLVLLRARKEVTRQLNAMSAEKLCVFFCIYNRVCAWLVVTLCYRLIWFIYDSKYRIRDWILFSC